MALVARAALSVENAWASGICVVRQVRSKRMSWPKYIKMIEGRCTHHAVAGMADVFSIDKDHCSNLFRVEFTPAAIIRE